MHVYTEYRIRHQCLIRNNDVSLNDQNILTFVFYRTTVAPMSTKTELKLEQIQRISALLRTACTGLLALIGIVAGVAVIAILAGRATSINNGSDSFVIADLGLRSRLILFGACVAVAVVLVKAVYHLRRLLDNYSRREIFTVSSAREIRHLGVSCILWGVVKIIWAFLPLVLLTNPPRSFSLTLDSVIIGLVIFGISWFAEMAAELREENELTI